jgi:Ca2+-binding RTX toxin-like protein
VTRTRTLAALATAAAAALALPAGAGAATIEVSATAGTSSTEFILYRVSRGEDNDVRLLLRSNSIVVVDYGTSKINVKGDAGFGRCRSAGRRRAICPRFGFETHLRDGDDRLTTAPGDRGEAPTSTDPLDYAENYEDTEGAFVNTLFVDAGDDDDVITGSRGDDVIILGRGTDRGEGRDGNDTIYSAPDRRPDRADGNGGFDSFRFFSDVNSGVNVDMGAYRAMKGAETDVFKRFERVHTGNGDDVLRGSARPEAMYGEGGIDDLDGAAGNDLVVGDSPLTSEPNRNKLAGGDGDDILDARADQLLPTSTLSCGAGSDRMLGAGDDLVDSSCEGAILRVRFSSVLTEEPLFGTVMAIAPAVRGADGAPTYEVPCPSSAERENGGCTGAVALEAPPATPQDTQTQSYGSGAFDLAPGQRGNVPVALTPAGKAAIAADQPVVVHVTMDLAPAGQNTVVRRVDFGWQAVLAP